MLQYFLNYPLPVVSTIMLVPLVFFLLKIIRRDDEMFIYLLYILLKFAVDVNMIVLASEKKNNLFLEGFSILFTIIIFTFCFLSIKELSKYHLIYKMVLIIFIPLFIYDEYLVNSSIQSVQEVQTVTYSYPLHSLIIIGEICLFFFFLIKNPHIPNILSYPFFYVCSGMLLIHSSTIFFSVLYNSQFRWGIKDEWIFHIQYIFEIVNVMLIIYGITRKSGDGIFKSTTAQTSRITFKT